MNAILFAGQGAQTVGMGRDLAQAFPECAQLFARANEILGYDLAKICFEGPESELVKSNHCQPAIFVVSAACYLALGAGRDAPDLAGVAGLSLGEWTALWMAQALNFDDVVRVLEARGRFMQEACEQNEGAMLSVLGLDPARLAEVVAQSGAEPANFNSPEQTVLSGTRAAIQQAEGLAKAAGAKRAILLNVAGAYHSKLMASAAERLCAFLRDIEIRSPAIPVVSNVTGRPHGSPAEIRQLMARQVVSPVQWIAVMDWFKQNGVRRYLECGPGRVLCGLAKRIHPEAAFANVQDLDSLAKARAVPA